MAVFSNPNTWHIPEPIADVGALTVVAKAMKKNVDILTGDGGSDSTTRAALISDLIRLGLVAVTGDFARVSDAGLTLSINLTVASGVLDVINLPITASYADDAAAATGGVPIGRFYRNGSAVQVRVT